MRRLVTTSQITFFHAVPHYAGVYDAIRITQVFMMPFQETFFSRSNQIKGHLITCTNSLINMT